MDGHPISPRRETEDASPRYAHLGPARVQARGVTDKELLMNNKICISSLSRATCYISKAEIRLQISVYRSFSTIQKSPTGTTTHSSTYPLPNPSKYLHPPPPRLQSSNSLYSTLHYRAVHRLCTTHHHALHLTVYQRQSSVCMTARVQCQIRSAVKTLSSGYSRPQTGQRARRVSPRIPAQGR